MLSLLKIQVLLAYFLVNCASASLPSHFTPHRPINDETNAISLDLMNGKIATRQLIESDCSLRILYAPNTPLPVPRFHEVLSTASDIISTLTERHGENTPVLVPVNVRNGNVMFTAKADPNAPSVRLLWGILEEALWVLEDFMSDRRPFANEVMILEGLNGRGIPLGQMTIATFERRGQQAFATS